MACERNSSIELLRDLLMLGICVLHSCGLGGFGTRWVSRLLMPCVPCFVFISGYYGIKATPLRILRVIGTAFACVPAIGIVSWFAGYDGMAGWKIAACGVADNWFLWAYVGLMCFAPALNHALECGNRLSLTLPIIVMSLGWGYLKGLPWFRTFMPTTDGLGGYTFSMMIGTYLVAGLMRRYYAPGRFKVLVLISMFLLCTLICVAGFSAYCSPVSVLWAAVLFAMFSRIKIGRNLGSFVAFVAKSTFPIFILHANEIGFGLIKKFATFLYVEHAINRYAMYMIVGLTVFGAGLLLDMPRRLLAYVSRQKIH